MTQVIGNLVGCGLLALAACGGSSAALDPEPNGTVDGIAFPVIDVISSVITAPGRSVAYIVLSSAPDACAAPEALVYHPGQQTLLFILQDSSGGTPAPPSAPGRYEIVDPFAGGSAPPRSALVLTSQLNATCGNDADFSTTGVSGAVTLNAVDAGAGAYQGMFDMVLERSDSGTRDHVTGGFNSVACGQLEAQLASEIVPPCQ